MYTEGEREEERGREEGEEGERKKEILVRIKQIFYVRHLTHTKLNLIYYLPQGVHYGYTKTIRRN